MLFSLAAAALLLPSASAQTTTRVSVDSAGVQGNSESLSATAISADGRYVVFGSYATNLVPGDTNGVKDTFIHDRQTGQTRRVSVSSAGMQGNGHSQDEVSISDDGRFVAFSSIATNLVPGDNNNAMDVFVHDSHTGKTSRCSLGASGLEGNRRSEFPALSADGRYVAFASLATNLVLGDTNNVMDVFVHDRMTGQTSRVSMDSIGTEANAASDAGDEGPGISADGRYVSFQSSATNLVPGDTNGVDDGFVHDRQTGLTTCISVNSAGVQGNAISFRPIISGNGRIVVFGSSATNLVPADTNATYDIFTHDRQTGMTSRSSVSTAGVQGNAGSDYATISADGRIVVFDSWANNLVLGYLGWSRDVYVHDRTTGRTSIASVNSLGVIGNSLSTNPAISADGRCVAFPSFASNLVPGDTNGQPDAFVHDRGVVGIGLTVAGNCPGAVRISIENAASHGWIALIYGNAGSSIKTGPPCQGLTMSVGAATLRRLLRANASGEVDYMTNASSSHCGLTLQVVDVTNCAASNTVVL
jgi:archaellum component FlaF (FlaF/FlaG flagellin family)